MTTNLKKKLTATLLGITLSGSMLILPPQAQGFDVLNGAIAILGVGMKYAQLNHDISYLDNQGRDKYLTQVKKQVGVNNDPRANAMLGRVMAKLSDGVAEIDPSIKKKPYRHFVNNQKTFNAFCTLGHIMSVNIGLFDVLNYNEDEIAFVVGHEMGHGQKNDPANGVRKKLPMELLSAIYASQNPNTVSILGSRIISNVGTAKGVTMPMEKRADELAFDYITQTNYNIGAGAAVWQRVIEKMGTHKSSFVSEIFNPNDHPGNISRRDNYSKKITKWSNNIVKVDNKNGTITLKGTNLGVPAPTPSMSSLERSYLIAGNLASIYHDKLRISSPPRAYASSGTVYVGKKAIMTLQHGDSAAYWVNNINNAHMKF